MCQAASIEVCWERSVSKLCNYTYVDSRLCMSGQQPYNDNAVWRLASALAWLQQSSDVRTVTNRDACRNKRAKDYWDVSLIYRADVCEAVKRCKHSGTVETYLVFYRRCISYFRKNIGLQKLFRDRVLFTFTGIVSIV